MSQPFTSYVFNDFVHQIVGNTYRLFLKYMADTVYGNFKTKAMATYNKAVYALLNDKVSRNTKLPAISLDPTFPLTFEEKTGNQLWRTPIESSLSKYLFDPIYQDDSVRITPGFTRYVSQVNVYMWFDSIYQMIDAQLRFLQVFHGIERFSKPYGMDVLCPLPDKIYTAKKDDGSGNVVDINWNHATPVLLDTIDKEIPMFKMYMSPLVKLTSISSIETRDKDSGEDIATCAMEYGFTMEFEVPTFFILETDWQIQKLVNSYMIGHDGSPNYVISSIVPLKEDPSDKNQSQVDPSVDIYRGPTMIYDKNVGMTNEDLDVKKWVYIDVDGKNKPINIKDFYPDFDPSINNIILYDVTYNSVIDNYEIDNNAILNFNTELKYEKVSLIIL